jgi:predicted Rossmann fold flavoprotein
MKVAVIGGGAAGLMAAAAVREVDPAIDVFVIERNDGLGKKVIISGGGRCNVTTGILDVKTVLTKYPRGNKFLAKAMHQFPPQSVYDWFESHGVPLKTQDDQRVFPQSDDGHDVVGAFERLFEENGTRVLLNTHVTRIEKGEDGFSIFFRATEKPLVVDKVILTTGGQAYRATGSTGDGYAFAMSLGHTITPLAASLNSFGTREKWVADISGLSFPAATLTAKRGSEPSFTGPFLFTHRGISGPAVFALSAIVAFERYEMLRPMEIAVDLFPDTSADDLAERIKGLIAENPKKGILNVMAMVVPKSLSEILGHEMRLAGTIHAAEVAHKDIMRCVSWLKGIPLHVVARGAGDEFVTAGGVVLKEVNPSTMESLVCPGLFFAGEILDVDGFTGGFNLQASWATGRLAGESAASQ